MRSAAPAVGISRRNHLGDQAAHLQRLEGHQPVEVGVGDLAHEPAHRLLALFGSGLPRVAYAHARSPSQGGIHPLPLGHRRVVVPDVGQLFGLDPAAAGVAVAPELDGDVVLQGVAQLEDEGFDGAFGLVGSWVLALPTVMACQVAHLSRPGSGLRPCAHNPLDLNDFVFRKTEHRT